MADKLNNILRIKGFAKFGKTEKSRTAGPVTVLDVDANSLRVVQAAPRANKTAVTRVEAVRIELSDADAENPEKFGQEIARHLSQLRLKPSGLVIGIPRSQVLLRTLRLPSIEKIDALASMVHFQIAKDLPFRLDEAVIDFKVTKEIPASEAAPEDKENPPADAPAETGTCVEVLVAAVPKDVIDFYQKATAAAGLKLTALGLLSHGTARFLQASQLLVPSEASAVVSLRHKAVNIDIIGENTLLFSRDASLKYHEHEAVPPPEAPAPAEETGESAAAPERPKTFSEAATIEVIRTLHSYASSSAVPVSTVYVAGATGDETAVVEFLQQRLTIPCKPLLPSEQLEIPDECQEAARKSLSAIGLAISATDEAGLPFDFLNPKKPKVIRDLRRIKIISAAALVAVLFIVFLGVRSHLLKGKEKILKAAQAELATEEKKLPIYRRGIQQRNVVTSWTNAEVKWLEHYAYLSTLLPPAEEFYVSAFAITPQGNIRMAVQVKTGEILAKVDKQLRAAGYDVKPIAVNPGADRFGYEFRSNVELVIPPKMTIDLAKAKPPAPRPADDASLDPVVMKRGGG